jgi:hypothetical protein
MNNRAIKILQRIYVLLEKLPRCHTKTSPTWLDKKVDKYIASPSLYLRFDIECTISRYYGITNCTGNTEKMDYYFRGKTLV